MSAVSFFQTGVDISFGRVSNARPGAETLWRRFLIPSGTTQIGCVRQRLDGEILNMFEESNIIAGLEIGTSKICAVVGEMTADGALNVIGVGQSQSHGVRKGEIINPNEVEEGVREAVAEAEQMANVEIRSVYLGVTGGHIRCFNNRGFHQVVSPDQEIAQEDVEIALENAKAINLPMEHSLLHSIRQHFLVDGEGGVTDPVGMHGSKLEVDLHVIHGKTTRLQNAVRLVRATSLKVEGLVFNGLASALAVLTPEQKELGALVIDLGAGTTEYAVYAEGIIRHSGVLPVGGDDLSNDLAYGLSLSLHRAEKLKREHGSAILTEETANQLIRVTDERGMEVKQVKTGQMATIVSQRLEEIFRVIAEALDKAGLTQHLRAGVVLCGGGARVPQITVLAERVFQRTATLGHAQGIGDLSQSLAEPEFATALGLVKYASLRQRSPQVQPSYWVHLVELFREIVRRLKG